MAEQPVGTRDVAALLRHVSDPIAVAASLAAEETGAAGRHAIMETAVRTFVSA